MWPVSEFNFCRVYQQVQFCRTLKFVELLVELFGSLQVYRKKHWRKAMTIVDSFLKKRRLKIKNSTIRIFEGTKTFLDEFYSFLKEINLENFLWAFSINSKRVFAVLYWNRCEFATNRRVYSPTNQCLHEFSFNRNRLEFCSIMWSMVKVFMTTLVGKAWTCQQLLLWFSKTLKKV